MSDAEDTDRGEAEETRGHRTLRGRGVALAITAAVVLGAGGLAVALSRNVASAAPAGLHCGGSAPNLSVEGSGRSTGSPDVLDFQAQVSVNASTAAAALGQDNATTSAVVAAIESAGVRAKDISTTDLSINPNYDTSSDGNEVITGYGVSNSIAVHVRRLGAAGAVIDAASSAGGDALSISSLDFARADPRTLEDQARRDAVHQAVTHAAAMARAAGQRLAGVCSVTDQSSVTPVGVATPLERGVAASAPSVPLEGGTQVVTAQVTIVYALAPRSP